MRKRRDQNTGGRPVAQSICDPPRRGLSPLAHIQEPGAGHVGEVYASGLAVVVGSEIDNILDIDIVTARCDRLESIRQTMRLFGVNAINRQAQIERRNSPWVKAATLLAGTIPRDR
jgi:hypothetical protein